MFRDFAIARTVSMSVASSTPCLLPAAITVRSGLSSTVSEPTKRSRNGGQNPLRLGRTGGRDGLSAVQSDNFASLEFRLGRGVFFAEGGPVSLKLGALINVANLCSILRSKFNEAPRLIYAERFWLHFTDCLRGRHPLVAEAPSWDLDRDGCPFEILRRKRDVRTLRLSCGEYKAFQRY